MTATAMRRRWSVSTAFTTQAVVALVNLVSGALLARGLNLDDRGIAALINLGTTLLGFLGGLGVSELILRSDRPLVLAPRALLVVVSTALGVAVIGPGVVALSDHELNLSTLVGVAAISLFSAQNSWIMAALFRRHGIRALAALQLTYSGSILLGLAAVSWAVTHLSLGEVVAVWLLAEALVTAFCFLRLSVDPEITIAERLVGVAVLRKDEEGREFMDVRRLSAAGAGHAIAQIGVSLSERGLMLVATLVGGLPATAQVAVAQSASSPIAMPVQALTSPLLTEAGRQHGGDVRRTYWVIAGATAVLAAAIAMVAYPYLIVPVFGPSYVGLRDESWLIVLFGLASACWRILHIRLRGRSRPGGAALTDCVALAATIAVAWTIHGVTVPWLLAYLLLYACVGLLAAVVVTARTRSRQEEFA